MNGAGYRAGCGAMKGIEANMEAGPRSSNGG